MTDLNMKLTITITDTTQLLAVANALNGGTVLPGGATVPPAIDYFPADPANAPFPSPEQSTSRAINGAIVGKPYLMSKGGAIWKFTQPLVPITTEYGSGYQVEVNGQPIKGSAMTQLIILQAQVWFAHDGTTGKLQVTDAPNAGIANAPFPEPWITTGATAAGHTVGLPPMPTPPEPNPVAPGSSNKVILFGSAQPFKTPQEAHDAAAPGDTITVGPEMHGVTEPYTLDVTKPVVVDFGGRVLNAGTDGATFIPGLSLDVSSLSDPDGYPHQLGAIVVHADTVIRGLRCTGAGMKEPTHGGTAAIRAGAPCNLVVDHCLLEKNQNGIGPSGYSHTIVATNTILLDNGLGPNDGGSHNVYAANGPTGGCVSATFGPGFTSIVTKGGGGGHAVKSRANVTKLVAPFYLYAADSSTLDLPDGSTKIVDVGAGILAKKAGDANHVLIGYGVESQQNGLAGVAIAAGATIDSQCDSPIIQTEGDITIDAGVVFKGTAPSVQGGGTVKGLPA